jgi:hypothetical protein
MNDQAQPERNRLLDDVAPTRRGFIKKVAVASAFTVPVVSSFSLSGVNTAFAQFDSSNQYQGPN